MGHSPIAPQEEFFKIGGDPWLAVELFKEIKTQFGLQLSPVLIYEAPTIARMAEMLAQPMPPRLTPLILLKPGTKQPPLFLAYGLGGNVFEFFRTVNCMQSEHPIYAVQARGTDGLEKPLNTVGAWQYSTSRSYDSFNRMVLISWLVIPLVV